MKSILKCLAVLAAGLVVASSAEAGGRRSRPPAQPTHDGYQETQQGYYYPAEMQSPPARMRSGAAPATYTPSIPTYGWNFSPSEGWGFRWSNQTGPSSPRLNYSWGYTPGKGWGFDWR